MDMLLLANIGVSQRYVVPNKNSATPPMLRIVNIVASAIRFDWRQSKYRSSPPHDLVAEEPSPRPPSPWAEVFGPAQPRRLALYVDVALSL